MEGATIDDVIKRLRLRTAPSKYTGTIHSCRTDGITAFLSAQFYGVYIQARMKSFVPVGIWDDWHSKGVPFKDHLYVAEVHTLTGIEFCECEDEGHRDLQYISIQQYIDTLIEYCIVILCSMNIEISVSTEWCMPYVVILLLYIIRFIIIHLDAVGTIKI